MNYNYQLLNLEEGPSDGPVSLEIVVDGLEFSDAVYLLDEVREAIKEIEHK